MKLLEKASYKARKQRARSGNGNWPEMGTRTWDDRDSGTGLWRCSCGTHRTGLARLRRLLSPVRLTVSNQ